MHTAPTMSASRRLILGALAGLIFGGRALSAAPADTKPAPIEFVRDIQPIFVRHCYECHGPKRQEGGLRLNVRAAALAGGDSGEKAIVPADTKASRLVKVINGTDAELKMPPDDEGQPLDPQQIELITRWVSEGANWPSDADLPTSKPEHWAWHKPLQARLPEVQHADWPRHPIDYFVLERLEKAGLAPTAEADRYTLARRVYLDIIGLPPTAEQVDAFVNDTQPGAYERMIDRALGDPAYGERWARVWLDLARYADSKGYGSDPLRTIWRYRDWVIEAFNRNLPYDQFTIEQLAGDLLPHPTDDQLLATAFHRNTMANDEGGTDDEEFRVAAVKDRIETTMQVWMGLTMGCAKCHSHKFDPITQREYYQAYAFFDQSEDADRGDEEPKMRTPTRRQEPQLAEQQARIAQVERQIASTPANLDAELAGALVGQIAQYKSEIKDFEKQIPTTPIMRELPADKRRVTHTMLKGNFRLPGDRVEPAVPVSFHPLPAGAPNNRLGLAKWLMDPENPLTARVAVNRLWGQLFGVGLVATEEDFGTQGLPPTHPEVVDWLAVEFMRGGWDIKDILRQIVSSATYRQSSSPAAEALQKDPGNRLLAHGPRFRLEAEMVRDQALAISGLLSRKQAGASVYPPQPPGLWRAAFNGERTWATSSGEDRYRRGLYIYWRRTVPYPSMAAFDAPSREICTLRRISTNTPLQAFVTLNDPVYVEAAQGLARRIVGHGGQTAEERGAFALRLALARPPQDEQIDQVVTLYRSELDHYRQDPKAAVEMATEPLGPLPAGYDTAELAAWTVVSNVILNLDGVLTKR
ncbi:MAG: PSD1 domain-containing protein [Planctomycetia bacterium]|nr:PSD1 domain-containing protein [Planctomycetia bacterium]